jgi:hypothetical protein
MPEQKREIFRAQALKHYLRQREKDVLPQFIAPRVVVLLWVILALLILVSLLVLRPLFSLLLRAS